VTDCGQHAVVVSNSASNGEVDIYYRSAGVPAPVETLASGMRSLFGVSQEGGGIVAYPGSGIIAIGRDDPLAPLVGHIGDGLAEVARGLAVKEVVTGSAVSESSEVLGRASLELMLKGLEHASQGVKDAIDRKT
jgi:hypothetical protein